MTCTYCGEPFVDYDATVEILGEVVHQECVRRAEALDATWEDA